MGLDQYLTRKHYIGANFAHNKVTGKIAIKSNGKPINIDLAKVAYIDERAGYWRKANQIHAWFVENVQNGVDDCKSYYVSRKDLQQLLDTVTDILGKVKMIPGTLCTGYRFESTGEKTEMTEGGQIVANPEVCKALPTSSGFFFGDTSYNEWYVEQLQETKTILEDALRPEYSDCEYEYSSSW